MSADDIDLVGHDEARSLEQLGPVLRSSSRQQDVTLLGRAPVVDVGEVEQDHEHPGPLDVAQERVAEPTSLGGALDESGDVGEHELVVLEAHHSEVRLRAW